MSARTEQAAVVAMYRDMVEALTAQQHVLQGQELQPVIDFMQRQQDAAWSALRELDRIEWEQEQADAIYSARFGDVLSALSEG